MSGVGPTLPAGGLEERERTRGCGFHDEDQEPGEYDSSPGSLARHAHCALPPSRPLHSLGSMQNLAVNDAIILLCPFPKYSIINLTPIFQAFVLV